MTASPVVLSDLQVPHVTGTGFRFRIDVGYPLALHPTIQPELLEVGGQPTLRIRFDYFGVNYDGLVATASVTGVLTQGVGVWDGAQLDIPITEFPDPAETIVLAYVPGNIQGTLGGNLAAFSGVSVTNSMPVPPSLPVTANLAGQWECDVGVTMSGGDVTGWDDQSGNGNHVASGSAGAPSTVLTPTGEPAIHFVGADSESLERIHATDPITGLPQGAEDRTAFLVCRWTSLTTGGGWGGVQYGDDQGNEAFGFSVSADAPTGNLVLNAFGGLHDMVTTDPGLGEGWMVLTGRVDSNIRSFYKDGILRASDTKTLATDIVALQMGRAIVDKGYCGLDVAAFVVYSSALSDADREAVESYLRTKYVIDTNLQGSGDFLSATFSQPKARAYELDGEYTEAAINAPVQANIGGQLVPVLEPAFTNLVDYPDDLTAGNWTANGGAVVTPDDTTAPDGTSSADRFYTPASSQQPRNVFDPGVSNGVRYRLSAWLQYDGDDSVNIEISQDNNVRVGFQGCWLAGHQGEFARYLVTGDPFTEEENVRVVIGNYGNEDFGYIWHVQLQEVESVDEPLSSFVEGAKVADVITVPGITTPNESRIFITPDRSEFIDIDDWDGTLSGDDYPYVTLFSWEQFIRRPPLVQTSINPDGDVLTIAGANGVKLYGVGTWTASVGGSDRALTNGVNTDGIITFDIAQIHQDEVVPVVYNDTEVVNYYGVPLAALTQNADNGSTQPFTPNVAPVLQSMRVYGEAGAHKLELAYNESMQGQDTVTAKADASPAALSNATVTGTTITFDLAGSYDHNTVFTASFAVTGADIIRDTHASPLSPAAFTDDPVTNEIPATGSASWSTPPSFSSSVLTAALAEPPMRFKQDSHANPAVKAAALTAGHYLAMHAFVTGDTTSENRVVDHVKSVVADGNAPHLNGWHHAWWDVHAFGTITLAKQMPAVWSQLSTDEQARCDFLMRIAVQISCAMTHQANTFEMTFGLTTGGGFNPNQIIPNIALMSYAYDYFGGEAAVNAEIAAFNWDANTTQMSDYGWPGMKSVWDGAENKQSTNNPGATFRQICENGGQITRVINPGPRVISLPNGLVQTYAYRGRVSGEPWNCPTWTGIGSQIAYTPGALLDRSLREFTFRAEEVDQSCGQSGCGYGYLRPGKPLLYPGEPVMPLEYNIGSRSSHHYAVAGLRIGAMWLETMLLLGYVDGATYGSLLTTTRKAAAIVDDREGDWFDNSLCRYTTQKGSYIGGPYIDDAHDAVMDPGIIWS